jgi:hypothetical protein
MSETPATPASSPDPNADPVTEPVEPVQPVHPVQATPAATPAYAAAPTKERRRPGVTTIAAWVGIVAGVVFIVAVVFFSGFVLGRASGGDHHRDRDRGPGQGMMFHRDGPGMFPTGPRGQFEHPGMPFAPGMQPGMQRGTQPGGPGMPGMRPGTQPPQQQPASPSTTAPAQP